MEADSLRVFACRLYKQWINQDVAELKKSKIFPYSLPSALEVFLNDMRYINPRFTYLLTYLLTYLRALGPELIPVYRQSARR